MHTFIFLRNVCSYLGDGMSHKVVIYYDDVPNIGVNATCVDWPLRNEYFTCWGEFIGYVSIEYGTSVELVEITAENYSSLCEQGVFNV